MKQFSDAYFEYLRSPTWQRKRKAALNRADHRCQVCNSKARLDVHHRTYERFGGKELPADLTVLCRRCHDLFHKGPKPRRSAQICAGCGKNRTRRKRCAECKKRQAAIQSGFLP